MLSRLVAAALENLEARANEAVETEEDEAEGDHAEHHVAGGELAQGGEGSVEAGRRIRIVSYRGDAEQRTDGEQRHALRDVADDTGDAGDPAHVLVRRIDVIEELAADAHRHEHDTR